MKNEIKVVELFAGVGGFRLGLEGWYGKSASSQYTLNYKSSYKVIWSNQWEPSSSRSGETQEANMVYRKNWPNNSKSLHYPYDLNSVAEPSMTDQQIKKNIPEHDMLVGGFPCQDYSVAGVNTKGLEGKKGVLWWNIHKILKARRPKYIFLENVDRLLKSPTNARGRDFAIILSTLWQLGYAVEWKVINAADYGMPQRRKRVYILAYHSDSNIRLKELDKWCLKDGVFATAFPSESIGSSLSISLSKNPIEITKDYKLGKFLNSGVMMNGKVWMTDFSPNLSEREFKNYSLKYRNLKDILIQQRNQIPNSFIINHNKKLKSKIEKIQLSGFSLDKRLKRNGDIAVLETEMDKWIYLKGKKAEARVSSKGMFYYKEGPMKLIEDWNQPSRTIITSEGGPGASRFKHLIRHENDYRRLLPIELERLNMFPDNHTKFGIVEKELVEIPANKRAFFMGNALVIGVIEKIGIEFYKKISEKK